MLDSLGPPLRRKCLSVLRKICSSQALLPRSLQIPLRHNRSDDPLYSGGFSDVWKGEHEGTAVAVKVLRVAGFSNIDKIGSVGYRPRPFGSVNGGAHYDCLEILQGSNHMEKSPPSKCAPIVRSDHEHKALRHDIRVDG